MTDETAVPPSGAMPGPDERRVAALAYVQWTLVLVLFLSLRLSPNKLPREWQFIYWISLLFTMLAFPLVLRSATSNSFVRAHAGEALALQVGFTLGLALCFLAIVFGGIAWFIGGLALTYIGILCLLLLIVAWPLSMFHRAYRAFGGDLPPPPPSFTHSIRSTLRQLRRLVLEG